MGLQRREDAALWRGEVEVSISRDCGVRQCAIHMSFQFSTSNYHMHGLQHLTGVTERDWRNARMEHTVKTTRGRIQVGATEWKVLVLKSVSNATERGCSRMNEMHNTIPSKCYDDDIENQALRRAFLAAERGWQQISWSSARFTAKSPKR